MRRPLLIPAVMIVLVGIAIFALPYILPAEGDNAELIQRTSTVGGGIIGLGLAFCVAVLVIKPKQK